jgi:hypothetical protein
MQAEVLWGLGTELCTPPVGGLCDELELVKGGVMER